MGDRRTSRRPISGAPDLTNHRSAYGEGKRAAEMLCTIAARQHGLDIVTARIFALLGPLLSLDIHFAAGNFIRDAMAGKTIVVEGAGRAVRSYLYAADLTVWLWAMLLRAPAGAIYNVGSEEWVSIAELAERVARLLRRRGSRFWAGKTRAGIPAATSRRRKGSGTNGRSADGRPR